MIRVPVWSFLSGAILLTASLATAQKFLPKTIQFKGDPEYSDQELMDAAGLKKGVVLTSAEMNDHSKKLMDTGVFDNLAYKFDGVDLVYSLLPAPGLVPMHFENLPLVPGPELDATIHEHFPLFHGKLPADGTLLQGVIGFLEELLASQGIHATINAVPSGVAGTRNVTGMTLSITSPAMRVGAVQLQGVSPALEAQVSSVAGKITGTPFNTENSGANLEQAITMFYDDRGYANAKVKSSRLGTPVLTEAGVDVPFSETIEEGHLYKLGAVHLPADPLITQAEIDKLAFSTQNSSPSNSAAIRNIWFSISQKYKSKGYLDCKVIPHPFFDEATGVVNYAVEVDPGTVYHLALLKFENVSDDLRKLLMRNWQMLPGDPFNESYVANFVLSAQESDPVLQRTLAGVKASYDVRADPQTHEVNCVLRLERVH
jgi:outer membrane protein insertion porin family